jgi:hypothetical protein
VLIDGTIAYDVPDVKRQGEPVDVQVTVASGQLAARLAFSTTDIVKMDPQALSAVMSGDGFTVTGPQDVRQPVSGDPPTTWRFTVLPTDFGDKQHLTLLVDDEVQVPGYGSPPQHFYRTRTLRVKVNPGWLVAGFAKGNWQWVLGVLGALGAWASRKVWRKAPDNFDRPDD